MQCGWKSCRFASWCVLGCPSRAQRLGETGTGMRPCIPTGAEVESQAYYLCSVFTACKELFFIYTARLLDMIFCYLALLTGYEAIYYYVRRIFIKLYLMDIGISLQFLQNNSEDAIFVLWMDDGTCWSNEIVKEKSPFATVKKLLLWIPCIGWTEILGEKLKDDDKACSRKPWTADVFTGEKEYV